MIYILRFVSFVMIACGVLAAAPLEAAVSTLPTLSNYQADPTWLQCSKPGDCAALEDRFCHNVHVVNKYHVKQWNDQERKTTKALKANSPADFCGKPGQKLPTIADGYPDCVNNACVFHTLNANSQK